MQCIVWLIGKDCCSNLLRSPAVRESLLGSGNIATFYLEVDNIDIRYGICFKPLVWCHMMVTASLINDNSTVCATCDSDLQDLTPNFRITKRCERKSLVITGFPSQKDMMTSSNGNIFLVTGLLCGEFTGHRSIPLTKASDEEPSPPLWRDCNVLWNLVGYFEICNLVMK